MERLIKFSPGTFADSACKKRGWNSGLWLARGQSQLKWRDNIRNLRSHDLYLEGVQKEARYTAGFTFKTSAKLWIIFKGEAKRGSRKSLRSIAKLCQFHHVKETIVFQNLSEGKDQENTQSNGRPEKTRDGWSLMKLNQLLLTPFHDWIKVTASTLPI